MTEIAPLDSDLADDHGLPLAPWQRSLLLRWFPVPTGLWRRKAQCDRCLRYTEVEDGPGPGSMPGRFCDTCMDDFPYEADHVRQVRRSR